MRRVLVCILILVVVSSLLYSPVNADEDKLNISLEINIDAGGNVNLMFFMGTGGPKEAGLKQIQVGEWAREWENWGLQFENTTQGRFEEHAVSKLNSSAVNFTKNVLGIGGEVTVNNIQTANYSDGICIKMSVTISDTTLHPLSFLGTEYNGGKIDEIANIKVKITASNAVLETPILEFIVFHYRLPTGEYMECSSTANTINVNSNPFFSPMGAFVVLIVFAVSGIGICLYGRKYMRGTKLGVEVWVLASIFYFCAFIPLSIYLVYVFIGLGLALSLVRMIRAIRVSKPKAKPKKTPASVSGAVVEKYLGKTEKPKPKKTVMDEEAERAYIDLSKYSEFKVIPKTGGIVKKEEEKEEDVKEKKPGIDVASLLKLGKKKETVKDKDEKEVVKLMEKKGFKKAGDKNA
jgi:hypothetical protein